jgi:hypothetical protein
VEVLPLELVQDELVLHLEVAVPLERVVQEGVVAPPGHPGQGPAPQRRAPQPGVDCMKPFRPKFTIKFKFVIMTLNGFKVSKNKIMLSIKVR